MVLILLKSCNLGAMYEEMSEVIYIVSLTVFNHSLKIYGHALLSALLKP